MEVRNERGTLDIECNSIIKLDLLLFLNDLSLSISFVSVVVNSFDVIYIMILTNSSDL
jgi:hypothetical protein